MPELGKAEAVKLTASIRTHAATLSQEVKAAHDGKAWKSMGYTSWATYVGAEFDISRSRGYQLIAHANAVAELADAAGIEVSTNVNTLTEGQTRDLDLGAVVDEVTDLVDDLPEGATDEDRAELLVEAVERRRHPKLRTVPDPPPASKPRRGPLAEDAGKAGRDLDRVVRRLERIAGDDRFPANRGAVAAALRGYMTYATEYLTDLLASLDDGAVADRADPLTSDQRTARDIEQIIALWPAMENLNDTSKHRTEVLNLLSKDTSEKVADIQIRMILNSMSSAAEKAVDQ